MTRPQHACRMSTSDIKPRIGFIGAGRMATALARGLCRSGFVSANQITASDVSDAARERFHAETGCAVVADNADAAGDAQVVVLAVKPQSLADVLPGLSAHLTSDHLLVSIVAGASLAMLEKALGHSVRLVRVMPNTPCLVGAGASGFARGASATDDDMRLVEQMLSTVGLACEVDESLLDAVTGLSGSGPAYVFELIEALSDGGVRAGLPRDVSAALAAQTVFGSARLVLETGEHPAALKDAVASPGGTTIAGLHALERGGFRAVLMDAVLEASRRSAELGRS